MPRAFALPFIYFDSAHLPPFAKDVQLFHDRDGNAPPASDTHEDQALEQLLSDELFAALIRRELGLSSRARYTAKGRSPFVSRGAKPGDIDAILVDPERPRDTIALECKRAKVRLDEHGEQKITRIDQLEGAHEQANALFRLDWFTHNYLAIIALVDGADDPTPNAMYRSTTQQTFNRLFEAALSAPLETGVGLLYLELAQVFRAEATKSGLFSVGVLRPAEVQERRDGRRTMIVNYMNENGRPVGSGAVHTTAF